MCVYCGDLVITIFLFNSFIQTEKEINYHILLVFIACVWCFFIFSAVSFSATNPISLLPSFMELNHFFQGCSLFACEFIVFFLFYQWIFLLILWIFSECLFNAAFSFTFKVHSLKFLSIRCRLCEKLRQKMNRKKMTVVDKDFLNDFFQIPFLVFTWNLLNIKEIAILS